ncbi:MAG: phosphopantetheine-binding protein, partial [Actinomycetota bacterium]|nr:phosphopantetheine-binding protein [Actinomycetota bacterium]
GTYVPPQGELEEQVAAVWSEVLGIERIGAETNFFDLGGHSLLLVKVHRRLRHQLGAGLSVVDLFLYPTIRALAQAISAERGRTEPATQFGLRRLGERSHASVVGAAERKGAT